MRSPTALLPTILPQVESAGVGDHAGWPASHYRVVRLCFRVKDEPRGRFRVARLRVHIHSLGCDGGGSSTWPGVAVICHLDDASAATAAPCPVLRNALLVLLSMPDLLREVAAQALPSLPCRAHIRSE